MSVTLCSNCERLIDTDADPECYYHTDDRAVCEPCRDESEATHPDAMS
jgi:hypothetical protein